MEQVGEGAYRVGYLGTDEEVADWVGAGFERADPEVEFLTDGTPSDLLDRIERTQRPTDPRMRSPLVDFEEPLDCLVCADDGDWDAAAVVERVREQGGELPVVLFVDDGSERLAGDAIAAGVSGYVRTDEENPTTALADRTLGLAAEYRDREGERRRRERAARILDDVPELVTVIQPGATVTYQNGQLSDLLGIDPEELGRYIPFERIHDDDWQSVREAFYDGVMDPGMEPDIEFRVADGDGQYRTLEARGRNRLDDPLVRGFIVTTRDISERKEHERELESYRRIVQNVGDPMYVLDPEGHFTWVNDAFLEVTGYEREFVLDSHVSAFMREQDVTEGTRLVAELLEEGRQWGRFEFVAENVEGEIRRFEDKVALLTDDDGNFRGTVGVLRDVTDGESAVE